MRVKKQFAALLPLVGAVFLLSTVLAACGVFGGNGARKMSLGNSEQVPAASGDVEVSEGDFGNTKLKVQVRNLARPNQLDPSATTYVVWASSVDDERQSPINIGALDVGKNLQAELETLTPLENFDLFITAERNGQVATPTGPQVMQTRVLQRPQ